MSDSVPQKHSRRSEVLKNISVSTGALGLGYGGFKVGRAAEAIERSTPSHIVSTASRKVKSIIQRAKHNFEIRFAKPGEMFRKYAPDSPFVTTKVGKILSKGATSRVKSHMRPNYTYPRANENFNRRAMREADIRTDLQGVHTEYRKKLGELQKQHADWKKLGRYEDIPKEHLKPMSSAQYEKLIVSGKNHPLGDMLHLRRKYVKEVQSNSGDWKGYGMQLSGKRNNIRKSMAEELKGNREIIQAHRKAHGIMPRPLTDKKMAAVKSRRVPVLFPSKPDPNYKWNHGIESATPEVASHVRITGTQFPIEDYKQSLIGKKQSIADEISRRRAHASKRGVQLDKALRSRATKVIQQRRKAGGKPAFPESQLGAEVRKTIHPIYKETDLAGASQAVARTDKARKVAVETAARTGRETVASQVARKRLGGASRGQLDLIPGGAVVGITASGKKKARSAPGSPIAENIANRLTPLSNLRKKGRGRPVTVERLERIQNRHRKLATWTESHAGEQALRKQILNEGNIFRPGAMQRATASSVVKSSGFPALTRLSKVGAVAAGAIGTGVLVKKLLDRRKQGQHAMSNLSHQTQFSAIDRLTKKLADSSKRHLVEGAALTGGISAADAVVSGVHPDPHKTRTQSAWAGAKRGALYGTVLAGTEYSLRKPLRKFFMSRIDRSIEFGKGRNFYKRVGPLTIIGKAGQSEEHIGHKLDRISLRQSLPATIIEGLGRVGKWGDAHGAQGMPFKSAGGVRDLIRKAQVGEGVTGGTVAIGKKGPRAYVNRASIGRDVSLREIAHHEGLHSMPVIGHSEIAAHFVGGLRAQKGKLSPLRGIKSIGHLQRTNPRRLNIEVGGVTGVAGAGYLAKRTIDKKKEPYVRHFAVKKDDDNAARDIAIGGIEGGAGVLATDRLIKRFAPEGSPIRRKVLIGAGVGGLATGAIGYGINRLLRQRRKSQTTQMSAIQFRSIIRSGKSVFYKGSKLDVRALVNKVGDRAATSVKIKSLKSLPRTRKSGFSEGRVARSNIYRPALITPSKEVIDGRHRIVRKDRMGRTHVQAIKVTAKDLSGVTMRVHGKPIQFDTQPRRYRRPVVAVDRYKKQIRNQEIDRHTSNLARSAVAGGVLGSVLRGTKKSILTGALAGAGTSAAMIVANRKRKDTFGDSPIGVKRTERLPYQVSAGLAGGILARKIYRKFSARGTAIQFERRRKSWSERAAQNPHRVAEELYTGLNRTQKLVRDVQLPTKGHNPLTAKVIDERGRERTPEWRRPWVLKAAGTAVLAAAIGSHRLRNSALGGRIAEKVKDIARAHPKLGIAHGRARGFVRAVTSETKEATNKALNKVLPVKDPGVARAAKEAAQRAQEEKIREHFKGITEGRFASRSRSIRFAETVPDWQIRDARGKSARIYAPGSQSRSRRHKKWHEKKSNRDLLATGLVAAALGGGASTVPLYQRFKNRQEAPPIKPVHAPGTEIKGVVEGKTLKDILKKTGKNIFDLSSRLDHIIAFETPIGVEATLKHLLDRNRPGMDYRVYAKHRLATLNRKTAGKTNLSLIDYLRGGKQEQPIANLSHKNATDASATLVEGIRKNVSTAKQ